MPSTKLHPSFLFVCTGNSCRSQLAEACLRYYAPDISIQSAGVKPAPFLAPATLRTLQSNAFSTDNLQPKALSDLDLNSYDCIITLSETARRAAELTSFSGNHIHHEFFDPYTTRGTVNEVDAVYQRVLNDIREWILTDPIFHPHV